MLILYGILAIVGGLAFILFTIKFPTREYELFNYTDARGYIAGILLIILGIKLLVDFFN